MTLLALLLGLTAPLPADKAPDARAQVVSFMQATQAQRHDDARARLDLLRAATPMTVGGSYLAYPQVTLAAQAADCAAAEAGLPALDGSAWQPSAWQAVCNCFSKKGEREHELALLERMPLTRSDKERCVALWFKGRMLEPAGRVKEAAAAYRELWVTCPLSLMGDQGYQALQRLSAAGRARFKGKSVSEYLREAEKWRRTGRYSQAQSTLKTALSRAQQDKDAATEAEVRLELVRLFITLGRYQSALAQTQTLLGSRRFGEVEQAAARRLTADIYSRRRRVDEAFEQLRACAAQHDAGDEAARCRLDWAELHIKVEQLAEARAVLGPFFSGQAGLPAAGPIAVRARWLDTWLAWRAGGIAAATAPIARLIEAEDKRGRELYWLGRWHLLAGDENSARRYWREASRRDLLEYYAVASRAAALRLDAQRGADHALPCPTEGVGDGIALGGTTSLGADAAAALVAEVATGLAGAEVPELFGVQIDDAWPRCPDSFDRVVSAARTIDDQAIWFTTAHPDITSAQELTDLALFGEAMRWLKPVGSLDRTPTERLALAHVYLRQGEPFWSNIISRHAVRPYMRGISSSRLEERASAEECAALLGPCPEPPPLSALPEQSSLGLRIAYPTPFEPFAVEAAARNDLPTALVYAVIYEESAFNPEAKSGRRARGLMQLINRTAQRMARLEGLGGFSTYKLFDPETNIRLGSRYLAELWRRYDGVAALVYASYHAGEKTVDRWVRERGHLPLDAFIEEIPYTSTRGYVKKCTATTAAYARLYFADHRLDIDYSAPLPLALRTKLSKTLAGQPLPGERKKKQPVITKDETLDPTPATGSARHQ